MPYVNGKGRHLSTAGGWKSPGFGLVTMSELARIRALPLAFAGRVVFAFLRAVAVNRPPGDRWETDPLTLADMSQATGLPTETIRRALVVLRDRGGMVDYAPGQVAPVYRVEEPQGGPMAFMRPEVLRAFVSNTTRGLRGARAFDLYALLSSFRAKGTYASHRWMAVGIGLGETQRPCRSIGKLLSLFRSAGLVTDGEIDGRPVVLAVPLGVRGSSGSEGAGEDAAREPRGNSRSQTQVAVAEGPGRGNGASAPREPEVPDAVAEGPVSESGSDTTHYRHGTSVNSGSATRPLGRPSTGPSDQSNASDTSEVGAEEGSAESRAAPSDPVHWVLSLPGWQAPEHVTRGILEKLSGAIGEEQLAEEVRDRITLALSGRFENPAGMLRRLLEDTRPFKRIQGQHAEEAYASLLRSALNEACIACGPEGSDRPGRMLSTGLPCSCSRGRVLRVRLARTGAAAARAAEDREQRGRAQEEWNTRAQENPEGPEAMVGLYAGSIGNAPSIARNEEEWQGEKARKLDEFRAYLQREKDEKRRGEEAGAPAGAQAAEGGEG